MRVLVVFAHDKKTSLNHAFADEVTRVIRMQGAFLDYLDLYERAQEIPFYIHDKAALEANNFFRENRERVMSADRLALIFPVYWYSTPGIMKCWIDLITSYAWRYTGWRYAEPLHKIKRCLFITTTMSPRLYTLWLGNPAQNAVKHTLKWMGMGEILCHEVGSASKLTPERFAKHLNKVEKLAQQLVEK